MKILHIIDKLDVGGAEKVFVDIVNILNEKNEEVDACFLLNGGSLLKYLNKNINVFNLNRKNKFSILKMIELKNICNKYDIIHCHFKHVYNYVLVVKILLSLHSKIILHDHSFNKSSNSLFKKINFINKNINYIAVSNKQILWFDSYFKGNKLLLSNIARENFKKIYLKEQFTFGIIGNIKPNKNQLFALKLAKELNASILIIGAIQDFDYYKKLKKYSLTHNIKHSFLLNIQDAKNYICNFKYGLQVSKNETGPLVLIEYLMQKKKFLTYNTGEVTIVLKKELPTSVVETFKVEDWLKNLCVLKNDMDLSNKLYHIYSEYFNEDVYYEKLLTYYNSL